MLSVRAHVRRLLQSASLGALLLCGLPALALADGWVYTAFFPPPSRSFHSTIVDSIGGRMLVYGGFRSTANPSGLGDLWSFDLLRQSWSQLSPTAPPAANWLHAAAYDGLNRRMLVLGGQSAALWSLDLASLAWSQLSPTGAVPPKLTGHGMIYDWAHQRLVVFGGNYDNQLYVLDLPTLVWTHVPTDSTFPSGRSFHSFTMERQARRALVYGGFDGVAGYDSDCYELDLNTLAWTRVNFPGAPTEGRSGHAAVMDAQTQRLYIVGGHSIATSWSDVRALNLSQHVWETLPNDSLPLMPDEGAPGVEWQSTLYLFGGRRAGTVGDFNTLETYNLPATSWTSQDSFPEERYDHVAFLDPRPGAASPRMIVFGGAHGTQRLADTWWLDVLHNVWNRAVTPAAPTQRAGAVGVLDSAGRSAVLFGGESGTGLLHDTWSLNLDSMTWQPVNALNPPSRRQYMCAALDAAGRRMWMFGGRSTTSPLGDLWYYSLDSAGWVQVAAPGGPGPRYLASMAFNPWSRRLMLFGGNNDTTLMGDLWTFQVDSLTWRQESWNSVSPGPHEGQTAFLDLKGQMVVYGGVVDYTNVPVSQTWVYNPQTQGWETRTFTPLNPAPRWRCAGVWDGVNRGMEMFGGLAATGPMSDSWLLLLLNGAVDVPQAPAGAAGLRLGPAAPNPSSGAVRFELGGPGLPGRARLEIFDASGRRVAQVWSGPLGPGPPPVSWNGRNTAGGRVGAGIYFARLQLPDGRTQVRKLTRLR